MPECPHDWFELTLPEARVRHLRARSNGACYEIRVWCPQVEQATQRLPVIYVLDGSDFFGTFVDSVARLARRPDATNVTPAMVVAVSPADTGNDARARRYADYTPGPPAEEPRPVQATGGADAFLEFLRDELAPLIEGDFPADPRRRILFGHSLAGFFTLHALATRPDSFETCIAVSPSIWWNEGVLNAGFKRLAPRGQRASIAVGEWEDELPPWQRRRSGARQTMERRARRAMIERAERIAATLACTLGSDRVEFHRFPDEDHASVVLVAIARALRFALRADASSTTGRQDSAAAK